MKTSKGRTRRLDSRSIIDPAIETIDRFAHVLPLHSFPIGDGTNGRVDPQQTRWIFIDANVPTAITIDSIETYIPLYTRISVLIEIRNVLYFILIE